MTLLPIVLVASKNAPYKTFKEFEAYARSNPGKVRVALTNFPSSIHRGRRIPLSTSVEGGMRRAEGAMFAKPTAITLLSPA